MKRRVGTGVRSSRLNCGPGLDGSGSFVVDWDGHLALVWFGRKLG